LIGVSSSDYQLQAEDRIHVSDDVDAVDAVDDVDAVVTMVTNIGMGKFGLSYGKHVRSRWFFGE
jgi:hypothetical protein